MPTLDPGAAAFARAKTWEERNAIQVAHAMRTQYAVAVTCELCKKDQHRLCIRPCECRHGRKST